MEAGNFVTESRVRFPMSPLPCTIMMMIGVIVLGGDYFDDNGDDYFPMSPLLCTIIIMTGIKALVIILRFRDET